MWQTYVAIGLVILALGYLIWRFRRIASGKQTGCGGTCDMCNTDKPCDIADFDKKSQSPDE